MTSLHAEMHPVLAGIVAEIHAADPDLAQSMALFAAQVSPRLDGGERAQLASILRRTVDLKVAVGDADPATPAAPQPPSPEPPSPAAPSPDESSPDDAEPVGGSPSPDGSSPDGALHSRWTLRSI
jgi:hypothetical protein